MGEDHHFLSFGKLEEAEAHIGFTSLGRHLGQNPTAIRIHVRDHRLREVTPTLELHYIGFVLTQSHCGVAEARRAAYEVSYGSIPRQVEVAGHSAVAYELGAHPLPGDPDPRQPTVIAWQDGEILCLLASSKLDAPDLLEVAISLYP